MIQRTMKPTNKPPRTQKEVLNPQYERSIFEISMSGRNTEHFPPLDIEETQIPSWIKRSKEIGLPSVSELDLIRHYTRLSQKNFSVDTHFYPLGSCTMKYNPKINEKIASLDSFAQIHPYQETEQIQGALEILYELEQMLCQITGFPYASLVANGGAQGEYIGVKMIRNYFEKKGDPRSIALIPDSAHGTNPASAVMVGFEVKEIRSNKKGRVDLEHLKELLNPDCACVMLTNPNTLGLFETEILKIAELCKKNGTLLYYDGANLNAIVGRVRPWDMGFDVMHINTHKTFSTPHGGGGPGCGPVCVSEKLKDFLPPPRITRKKEKSKENTQWIYEISETHKDSIGRIRWLFGNFLIAVRAYTYILSLGREGIEKVSGIAVLNANYLRERLKQSFSVAYDGICMHEFILSLKNWKKEKGVSALDLAKRLIDYGIHPPTIYFPLIVPEAVMIEPTETESKDTLDFFVRVLEEIQRELNSAPSQIKEAPFNQTIGRLDEVQAVKNPKLVLQKETSK